MVAVAKRVAFQAVKNKVIKDITPKLLKHLEKTMKLKCTSCHKNISDNFIEKIFDNSHNGKSLVDTLIPKSFQEVTLSEVVVYGEDISKNIVYSKDDKKLSSGEISKLKKVALTHTT
ncbi:hypothetical protein LMG7974_01182 [Campylobacter majalis]|uniref:Uncharacterized protein n=1 Tax=Campylobacter majalis TaxID=2790656 RepID=A0ABN7K8U7_9BACT|nr:hypothetical protein [Campylobacter majalis]CAD7288845.1 hypothetical protein LMG7974_01182 [Campylobacter majalis]